MLNFREFLIKEEDSDKTKVQEIKTNLSKKFDEIKDAKKSKNSRDPNSEIASINKQASIYQEISVLLKSLSAEMQKTGTEGNKDNIY